MLSKIEEGDELWFLYLWVSRDCGLNELPDCGEIIEDNMRDLRGVLEDSEAESFWSEMSLSGWKFPVVKLIICLIIKV